MLLKARARGASPFRPRDPADEPQDPRNLAPLAHALDGAVESPIGPLPRLRSTLAWPDRLGALRVRLGFARSRYRVLPGLYALGNPGPDSPVLASANYKLSLDALRSKLAGLDAWILVLDTKGVNVWCAAGKGSFGNAELARRISSSRLALVVGHREIILPQLCATGVSAHRLLAETGWRGLFGPVEAADLRAWLRAGRVASPEMRRVRFGLGQRLVLVPTEIKAALPLLLLSSLPFFLFAALAAVFAASRGASLPAALAQALGQGLLDWLPLAGAFGAGLVLVPALLPWLPGRAFSLKGVEAGILVAGGLALGLGLSPLAGAALLLASAGIAGWFALAFTGSSTYTSLSGVALEVRRASTPLRWAMGVGYAAYLAALSLPGWLNGGL